MVRDTGLLGGGIQRHRRTDPSRQYVRLGIFCSVGVAAGFALGLIFMGTVHTMLEIRADRHYMEEGQGSQPVQEHVKQAEVVPQKDEASSIISGGQDTIHTICTSNGSPYLNFQNRIMYGTYLKAREMPGGEKLVAFTRILHRSKPDVLVEEIPTFRAHPLTPKCDIWCEFPVSDRPDAVEQWLTAAEKDPSMIKAPWILMIETDYVWHKPVQAPQANSDAKSIAFPFGYIQPQNPNLGGVMRLMYPKEMGPLSDIPASGPAPVLLRPHELKKIVPDWKRLTAHIEAHKETKDKLGWVREMYAWSVAAALNGVKFDLTLPPGQKLIVQPPADRKIGDAAMFHYTWGSLIHESDAGGALRKIWEFDKRAYTDAALPLKVPAIKPPPRWKDGLKLQDGVAVDEDLINILDTMIGDMNAVIPGLPDLTLKAKHYPPR